MFLSRDSLQVSAADWVEHYEKMHKRIVKRTRQLKRANHELANQIAECGQIEEALWQAEQKYRGIFENAIEGIFQTTSEGRYIACNPALARLYGYESPDELLTKLTDIRQQLYVDPHRCDEFIEQLRLCDSVYEFEAQVYRKNGSIIWISENARAARDENGNLLYYEGFVIDITYRKLAETSLRQSEAQLIAKTEELERTLRELNQAQAQLIHNEKLSSLGQLVAGVAHEINNPVNFLCNNLIYATQYTEDLLDLLNVYAKHYPQAVPEVQKAAEAIDLDFLVEDFPKTLSSMQLGADRICQIVQSLRNFSRLDEVQMTAVDLHEVIDSTLLILQSRLKPKGDNPGVTVIKEYGKLPQVKCYPSLLNQVLMNLVCNAIDTLEECDQKQYSTSCCEESAAQTLVSIQSYGCQKSVSGATTEESHSASQNLDYNLHSRLPSYRSRASLEKLSPAPKAQNSPLVDIGRTPRTILIRTEVRSSNSLENKSLANPLETSTLSFDTMSLAQYEVESTSPVATKTPGSTKANSTNLQPLTRNSKISGEQDSFASPSTSWIVVRIIDNGLGMTEDVRQRIFDPFFTTKPLGKGTGLGLSICYQIIVEKHGGQLKCFSAPNQGTEFVIEIPIKTKQ